MRPATKSPPFLIIGLLVVMCILAYNYWTVSSKNGELLSQVEAYQLDFRSVSDKHLTVEKRAAALTSKLSELQSQLSQAENSAAERENRATDLKGQVDSLNSQLLRAQQTLVTLSLSLSLSLTHTHTHTLKSHSHSSVFLELPWLQILPLPPSPPGCDSEKFHSSRMLRKDNIV